MYNSTDDGYEQRLCQSYYNLFVGYNISLPPPAIKNMGSEDYLIYVRKCMLVRFPAEGHHIDQCIAAVRKMGKAKGPHQSYYEWFKNDPKACHWVWYKLRMAVFPNNTKILTSMGDNNLHSLLGESNSLLRLDSSIESILTNNDQKLYESLSLPLYPASHTTRMDIITYILFSWQTTQIEKEAYITQLQREWHELNKRKDIFSFITPEKNEACKWVWDYLNKNNMVPKQLIPINDPQEIYLAIYTSYYNWCNTPVRSESEIKVFEFTFGNTKGQYRHREKTKEKKAINIRISADTKDKLEELMEHRGLSQASVIEWAITYVHKHALDEK